MKKRMLIIGAGILQLPAIVKAKKLGLEVAVVDINPNASGIKYADKFYKISTNDTEGILAAAMNFKPNGVMTIATDRPMKSVAFVAEKLQLPGISTEVADKATDKIKMIKCFEINNIPHPRFYVISTLKELQDILLIKGTPFILKPDISSGSLGVVLINHYEDAGKAYNYSKSFSISGLLLAEEYMQGPEVSVEIIRIMGKSYVLAITDKLTTGNPYFVEIGHSQPSQLSNHNIEQIKDVAIKAVEAIGIDNNPAHVEIILTGDGPKLVELGARMGGDCICSHLVPLSTGIDMVKASILLALGKSPDVSSKYDKGAAIRFIIATGSIVNIEGVDIVRNNKNVKLVEIVKKIGDEVKSIHGSGDRIGYVIAQNDSAQSATKDCELALMQLKITVSPLKSSD